MNWIASFVCFVSKRIKWKTCATNKRKGTHLRLTKCTYACLKEDKQLQHVRPAALWSGHAGAHLALPFVQRSRVPGRTWSSPPLRYHETANVAAACGDPRIRAFRNTRSSPAFHLTATSNAHIVSKCQRRGWWKASSARWHVPISSPKQCPKSELARES